MGESARVSELILWLLLTVTPAHAPCAVFEAIDAQRGYAYAQESETLLNQVYASAELAKADAKMLRDYGKRDVRVVSLFMERDSCEPGEANSVEVVERLARVEIEFEDGSRRLLPIGEWTQRTVTLEFENHWRIAAIRAHD